MKLFWIFIGIISVIAVATFIVASVAIWICNVTGPCKHSYKRIDTCNDKKMMILVCYKCGKIKKLRK